MTNEEALKLIPFVRHSYNTKNFTKDSYTAGQWFGIVENALKQKAERRGRWIFNIDDEGWSWDKPYMCTQCGKWAEKVFNFCPNCGATMEATE